ncbi:UNKNOWN [Stylonychia lemnae]|uniref:Uncharacterized protein n=1 Tax=Stylonychia lemnae TaxID=5949 RepID=A0A078B6J8_STYLE|nr:UNKNOWN [Stylonychia lemnae]|eukprot:CDW89999.1 UNKNOWN [Stylonychia lemnae]
MKYTHFVTYTKNLPLLKQILTDQQGKEDVKTLEDKYGNKVAHIAAYQNDIEIIQILSENGINIYDSKNEKGETPQTVAEIYNSEKISSFLSVNRIPPIQMYNSQNRSSIFANSREIIMKEESKQNDRFDASRGNKALREVKQIKKKSSKHLTQSEEDVLKDINENFSMQSERESKAKPKTSNILPSVL